MLVVHATLALGISKGIGGRPAQEGKSLANPISYTEYPVDCMPLKYSVHTAVEALAAALFSPPCATRADTCRASQTRKALWSWDSTCTCGEYLYASAVQLYLPATSGEKVYGVNAGTSGVRALGSLAVASGNARFRTRMRTAQTHSFRATSRAMVCRVFDLEAPAAFALIGAAARSIGVKGAICLFSAGRLGKAKKGG